jgi:hypothetical protein
MKKQIRDYTTSEQLTLLTDICNRIYIARNISLDQEKILEELQKIDCFFREVEYHESDE